MNKLKNLHLLEGIVKPSDLNKMEHAADMHHRYSNITFKIVEVNDKIVRLQAAQGKSAAENYADKKRLIEIVNETFGRFFSDRKILVNPIPYKEPEVNQVNPEWINKMMLGSGVKLKEITEETGLNYSYLSSLINGNEPISQVTKAFFWYYFALRNQAAHGGHQKKHFIKGLNKKAAG
jgi:hypothetical protein